MRTMQESVGYWWACRLIRRQRLRQQGCNGTEVETAGHRRRAEPQVPEYLGRELRASPRRRRSRRPSAPGSCRTASGATLQPGQDEYQPDRPQLRRGLSTRRHRTAGSP